MDTTSKKAYGVAVVIQLIYTGMYVVSKAAFDHGMSTYVFIFYRQAAATALLLPLAIVLERKNAPPMSFRLFLKLFFYALLGNTLSMNLYNISLKYTSATVASATSNSVPVVTFFLAVLQAWCIEKRGPVFLAMSNPLGLLLTIFCSSFFLGEIVRLGSLLGSGLLVGGLYSVLWGKSKDHLHQKHQDDDEEKQQQPPNAGDGCGCGGGDEKQLKDDQIAMEEASSPLRHQSG